MLGIDYDDNPEEQALGIQRSKNGNTDMILYVQFNKKENTVHMLQIPRDVFVGLDLPTGGTGRTTPCMPRGGIRKTACRILRRCCTTSSSCLWMIM